MAAKKKKAVKKKAAMKKPAKKKKAVRPAPVEWNRPPKCDQDKICDWLQGVGATLRFASPKGYVRPANGPAPKDAWVEHAQWCLEQLVAAVIQLETDAYYDANGNHIPGKPNPIFAPGGGGTPPPPPPTYPPN